MIQEAYLFWSCASVAFIWLWWEGWYFRKWNRLGRAYNKARKAYTVLMERKYRLIISDRGLAEAIPEFKKIKKIRRKYLSAVCDLKEFERDMALGSRGKDFGPDSLFYHLKEDEADEYLANRRFLYDMNLSRRYFWSYIPEFCRDEFKRLVLRPLLLIIMFCKRPIT